MLRFKCRFTLIFQERETNTERWINEMVIYSIRAFWILDKSRFFICFTGYKRIWEISFPLFLPGHVNLQSYQIPIHIILFPLYSCWLWAISPYVLKHLLSNRTNACENWGWFCNQALLRISVLFSSNAFYLISW